MSDFDFADVFDSMWGNESTGGADEIPTCSIRRTGEDDGKDGDDVELWGQGCIVYRPADPTDDGRCQLLVAKVGSRPVAIASRDLRASQAAGAMNKGDAALVSPTGKNAFRANADGSISILQQGESTDAFLTFEKDGTIIFGNPWGQFELGPNGFLMTTITGEALAVGGGFVNALAPTVALSGGSVMLGATAAVPLALIPTVVPTGTAVAAFAVTKPCPNIFV